MSSFKEPMSVLVMPSNVIFLPFISKVPDCSISPNASRYGLIPVELFGVLPRLYQMKNGIAEYLPACEMYLHSGHFDS